MYSNPSTLSLCRRETNAIRCEFDLTLAAVANDSVGDQHAFQRSCSEGFREKRCVIWRVLAWASFQGGVWLGVGHADLSCSSNLCAKSNEVLCSSTSAAYVNRMRSCENFVLRWLPLRMILLPTSDPDSVMAVSARALLAFSSFVTSPQF